MRPHHRPPRRTLPGHLAAGAKAPSCLRTPGLPVRPYPNTSHSGHLFTQVSAPPSRGDDHVSFTFESKAEHQVDSQFQTPMTSRFPTLKGHDESQQDFTVPLQVGRAGGEAGCSDHQSLGQLGNETSGQGSCDQ